MRLLLFFCIIFGAQASDFTAQIKPFLQKYCIDCHGPKKEKGDLRLDTLKTDFGDSYTAENWQHVLDELNGATMPPEDEKQPTAKELTSVLELLTYELELAKKKLYGKDRKVVLRKLNKREYINSIYDLTGVKLPEIEVPNDSSSSEFDTNGEGLFMSAYLLNKYRGLAEEALGMGIKDELSYKPLHKVIDDSKKRRSKNFKMLGILTKAKENAAKGNPDRPKAGATKADIRKYNKRNPKVSEKDFQLWTNVTQHPAAKKYSLVGSPVTRLGKHLDEIEYSFFNDDFQPGWYRFKLVGGTVDAKEGDIVKVALTMKIGKASDVLASFEFTESIDNPQTREALILIPNKEKMLIESRIQSKTNNRAVYAGIGKMEISGPLKEETHKKVFAQKRADISEDEYVLKTLKNLIARAFRNGEPSEKFLDSLMKYYKLNRAQGMSVEKAIQAPLAVILSSPKFLYKVEKESKFISDQELAVRLSYFLWSTSPDEELMTLAKAGKLSEPSILKSQVVRMLKDQRSLSMSEGFVPQWLHLHKLQEVDVNTKIFRSYNASIGQDIERESIHFFDTLVRRNFRIENLIDSDFVVVNDNLKSYYGLDGKKLDGFEPLKLAKNSDRGGLLGQASVLIMTGNGERSSPVMRGDFILSKLLGMPSPEPPPNVPQLDSKETAKLSVRQALKLHQEKPQCKSCHQRIDPAGFGLESFDAAGLVRKTYKKTKGEIDTKGHLPGGRKFNNHHELKDLLMSQKSHFIRSLTEALMGYAYGRDIGFADELTIDKLVDQTKAKGNRMGYLVMNIVLSPEFRQK